MTPEELACAYGERIWAEVHEQPTLEAGRRLVHLLIGELEIQSDALKDVGDLPTNYAIDEEQTK